MKRPYANDSKPEQGQWVELPRLTVYYETMGAGEPLLLLHGYGGCCKNWHPFTETLAKQYQLYLIDLRGHGYTTNPSAEFSHREAAMDVIAWMDAMGLAQCSAMGMSTGGMVLMHLATIAPQRLKTMVLISATTHFPEQARTIMRRASYATLPPEVRDMYQHCAPYGEAQIRSLLANFNALADTEDDMCFKADDLAKITTPTLLVHGERDVFFPIEIAQTMQRSMPNASLWSIPQGEHVPIFNLLQPFNEKALQFLKTMG